MDPSGSELATAAPPKLGAPGVNSKVVDHLVDGCISGPPSHEGLIAIIDSLRSELADVKSQLVSGVIPSRGANVRGWKLGEDSCLSCSMFNNSFLYLFRIGFEPMKLLPFSRSDDKTIDETSASARLIFLVISSCSSCKPRKNSKSYLLACKPYEGRCFFFL